MTDVVIKAVGDMKAAVRFLRQDAATVNNYRIDTNLLPFLVIPLFMWKEANPWLPVPTV